MTAWALTWLWQGLALTLAMSAALRLLPRLNAATRYWMWWGTLAALAWLGFLSSPRNPSVVLTPSAARASDPLFVFHIPSAPDTLLTIVLVVWVAIALVALLRLLTGVRAVYGLRDRCRPFPVEIEAQLPLWLETQACGRRTRLMLCDAVSGATVLGFHRPCIAVPSSLLSALTPDELDQIVLHEYAHVQRRDDWARLAQAVLQSALWIHPAVAIIGRGLNLEREMACDEWVVARTALPNAYARCLTRAAEVLGRIRAEPMLGPALLGRKGDLVRRIDRLLSINGRTRRNASAAAALAGACALAAMTVQLRALPLVAEAIEVALPVAAPNASAFALRAPVDKPVALSGGVTVRLKPDPTGTGVTVRLTAFAKAPTVKKADTTEPALIVARTFDGRYRVVDPAPAATDTQSPWRMAGAAGTGIGAAGRKTGIAIATTFARAGASLARKF